MANNFGENSGVIANTVNGGINILPQHNKRIPSLLPKFIEVLVRQYSSSDSDIQVIENNKPYTIEDKISHNHILIFKEMIEEYYSYYPICESTFESLRHIDENSKRNILTDINDIYRDIKLEYLEECMESENPYEELGNKLKKNSDIIINKVKKAIKVRIQNAYDGEQFNEQDLTLCLNIFVCYALGECKILERPELICRL